MPDTSFEFEQDFYGRIGIAAEHEIVIDALEHFWFVVGNKGFDSEPSTYEVTHSTGREENLLIFSVTWLEEADPEEEDPDFLIAQTNFMYTVDILGGHFHWHLVDTLEGGTETVFDLGDDEDEYEDD